MKFLKWASIFLMGLGLLVWGLSVEEDWRGKHDWQDCKRKLEARGEAIGWDKFIPKPVPDDQNFFKAPQMTEWFAQSNHSAPLTNDFTARFQNDDTSAMLTNHAAAEKYLQWSSQLEPDLVLIRQALKRPQARIEGDYSNPFEMPEFNFVAVRAVAQVLAQRVKCDLEVGQMENALEDLTLLNELRRVLEGQPDEKSTSMVTAMIDVGVASVYVDPIRVGLQTHRWQESQLTALQIQLAKINLLLPLANGLRESRAISDYSVESMGLSRFKNEKGPWYLLEGWFYQNNVFIAVQMQKILDAINVKEGYLSPRDVSATMNYIDVRSQRFHPYTFMAGIALPNFTSGILVAAQAQTSINEAQIACALERYRLANGAYPESLNALVPKFLDNVPRDVINGGALLYRRTNDGKFLLYSVGWNEKDDGGQLPRSLDEPNKFDWKRGDWVWEN